jgi:prolyl-tRNA editing enzyme YbaK/EbsC (Cys-tRNA(Pro) deacylase)
VTGPGTLVTGPALARPDLLAPAVTAVAAAYGDDLQVAPIDPDLADTAAFCARYAVAPAESANCVVVTGRRGDSTRTAALVVLATTRADVNGVVRRRLDVRKASFTPHAQAVQETGMEHGGITPFGLPRGWPVLVDARVVQAPRVVVGCTSRCA